MMGFCVSLFKLKFSPAKINYGCCNGIFPPRHTSNVPAGMAIFLIGCGYKNRKPRPRARFAAYSNIAAMERNNLFCNRKSQAASLWLFFRARPSVVPLKEHRFFFILHPRSVI